MWGKTLVAGAPFLLLYHIPLLCQSLHKIIRAHPPSGSATLTKRRSGFCEFALRTRTENGIAVLATTAGATPSASGHTCGVFSLRLPCNRAHPYNPSRGNPAGIPQLRTSAGMTVRFARNGCVPCGGMALFKRGGDTAYWGMAMLYSNASGATQRAGTTPPFPM